MTNSDRKKKSESAEVSVPTQFSLVMNGHNPFWKSDLFDRTYLENDVPVVFKELWETDESGPFYEFTNDFMDLCKELNGEKLSSWNEQNTINKVIKPVLKMLGYFDKCSQFNEPYLENEAFTVEVHGEAVSYRPDLILVDDPKELKHIQSKKGEEKLEKAQKLVILPIEAKYWERITDKENLKSIENRKRVVKTEDRDETATMDFDDQTLKYMEILEKDYGILTDGKVWRLYNREISTQNKSRYFEFDLGKLMFHVQGGIEKNQSAYSIFIANAKYFYHIFSKSSLHGKNKFVDQLLEFSKKYVSKVEEDLKDRFVKAMSIACNGFNNSVKSINANSDIELIRNVTESHLFNILFIRFCEVRNILPVKQDPSGYRLISISNILDKLDQFDPELEEDDLNFEELKSKFKSFTYKSEGFDIYEGLLKLTKIVQDGANKSYDNFEIKGFKESIFTKEEWKFAQTHKLSNQVMANVLFQLGYSKAEIKIKGKSYQQIPYNFFTPRQLGSIYESFLEFKLDYASEDMVFINKQWKTADLKLFKDKDIPKVKKGQLFFTPDNKERKVTGAYYTPEYITQYIIQSLLGPKISKLKDPEKIFDFKICDPAMGSGHFLSNVLNYLAKSYLEKYQKIHLKVSPLTFAQAKQKIIHNVIYGSDINPRAVKLAKMSLWLESAQPGNQLEDLSDQLINADTLLLDFNKEVGVGSFDFVIGNPPYLSELRNSSEIFQKYKNATQTKCYYESKMDLFYFFIEKGLDLLKDDGNLGFIVAQYWLTRSQTKKLHLKIYQDSEIFLHINLKENIVFNEAKGLHSSILLLKKGSSKKDSFNERFAPENFKSHSKLQKWLYSGKDLVEGSLSFDKKTQKFNSSKSGINFSEENYTFIEDSFVQIGIDTHQEFVTKNHLKLDNTLHEGDGIFVITSAELKRLRLNKSEEVYIRPFFEANQISIHGLEKSDRFIIYIDSSTSKAILKGEISLPKIKNHFDAFKKVITSDSAPYGLHRARQEKWFSKGSKVICPRKTKEPNFVWTSQEAYFNQSVVIIKTENQLLDQLISIILNSDFALERFKEMKTQGEQLQIDKEVILRFPFPKIINFKSFNDDEFAKKYPSIIGKIKKSATGINFSKSLTRELINEIADSLYQSAIKLMKAS